MPRGEKMFAKRRRNIEEEEEEEEEMRSSTQMPRQLPFCAAREEDTERSTVSLRHALRFSASASASRMTTGYGKRNRERSFYNDFMTTKEASEHAFDNLVSTLGNGSDTRSGERDERRRNGGVPSPPNATLMRDTLQRMKVPQYRNRKLAENSRTMCPKSVRREKEPTMIVDLLEEEEEEEEKGGEGGSQWMTKKKIPPTTWTCEKCGKNDNMLSMDVLCRACRRCKHGIKPLKSCNQCRHFMYTGVGKMDDIVVTSPAESKTSDAHLRTLWMRAIGLVCENSELLDDQRRNFKIIIKCRSMRCEVPGYPNNAACAAAEHIRHFEVHPTLPFARVYFRDVVRLYAFIDHCVHIKLFDAKKCDTITNPTQSFVVFEMSKEEHSKLSEDIRLKALSTDINMRIVQNSEECFFPLVQDTYTNGTNDAGRADGATVNMIDDDDEIEFVGARSNPSDSPGRAVGGMSWRGTANVSRPQSVIMNISNPRKKRLRRRSHTGSSDEDYVPSPEKKTRRQSRKKRDWFEGRDKDALGEKQKRLFEAARRRSIGIVGPAEVVVDASPAPSLLGVRRSSRIRNRGSRSSDSGVDYLRRNPRSRKNVKKILCYPTHTNARDVVTIYETDVERLEPGMYFNDNLIDFHLRYMRETMWSAAENNRCHVFSTFFYKKLREKGQYANVRKWTRNVNIFEKDFILVPINMSIHWSLAIICMLPKAKFEKENEADDASSRTGTATTMDLTQSDGESEDSDEETIDEGTRIVREVESRAQILHLDSLGCHDSTSIASRLRRYLNHEWARLEKKKRDGAADVSSSPSPLLSRPSSEASSSTTSDSSNAPSSEALNADAKGTDAAEAPGSPEVDPIKAAATKGSGGADDEDNETTSKNSEQTAVRTFADRNETKQSMRDAAPTIDTDSEMSTTEDDEPEVARITSRARREVLSPPAQMFTTSNLPLVRRRVPLQTNGCDCGVFVLKFAEMFVRHVVRLGPRNPNILRRQWFCGETVIPNLRSQIRLNIVRIKEEWSRLEDIRREEDKKARAEKKKEREESTAKGEAAGSGADGEADEETEEATAEATEASSTPPIVHSLDDSGDSDGESRGEGASENGSQV